MIAYGARKNYDGSTVGTDRPVVQLTNRQWFIGDGKPFVSGLLNEHILIVAVTSKMNA
jgi:hypothetical protein